jgi:hypothetical protein
MTVLTLRSCKRYAVRQAATVKRPGGDELGGLLIELSQEGGRVSGLGPVDLSTGDAVVLELGEVALSAVVRWASPGVIGLRFAEALHTHELSEMLTVSRSPQGALRYGT